MKSVRDKIALFSTSNKAGQLHQSTEDVNQIGVNGQSMTRAYTHSDVRYEQASSRSNSRSSLINATQTASASAAGSVLEQRRSNVKSVSSADLTSHRRTSTVPSSGSAKASPAAPGASGGRSQSLMEIGTVQTLPKRRSVTNDVAEARQISLPPTSSDLQRLSLTTPPWKTGQSKYSPAFKQKPFAVYNTAGNVRPAATAAATSRQNEQQRRIGNSSSNHDDSDTDSAVSSGRSSIVSPPPTSSGAVTAGSAENPRVLKKNSVEAINRRNVLNSCKKRSGSGLGGMPDLQHQSAQQPKSPSRSNSIKSLGKPASRSSSFTIAERKKSLECMSGRLISSSGGGNGTSNGGSDSRRGSAVTQDSSLGRRSTSRDAVYEVHNSSRRSSRGTIGEVDEERRSEADGGSRVTTPTKANQGRGRGGGGGVDSSPANSRSCSVTPTADGGGGGRRIVSRNNSITSDRSTYSNRSTTPPEKCGIGGYPRSISVVSKDSGLPEEDSSAKWSTLEKKYSSKKNNGIATAGDARNKIAKFNVDASAAERPKELTLSSSVKKNSISSTASPKPSSSSSSGSSSIRELTERFENKSNCSSRRESVVSNASSVLDSSCVSSVVIATPTNPSFRIGDKTFVSSSWIEESSAKACDQYFPEDSTEWESFDPSTPYTTTPTLSSKNILKPQMNLMKDRKYSVPIYSESSPSKEDGRSNAKDVKMRDRKNQNAAPSRPSSLIETSTSGAGNELKIFEIGNLGERQNMIMSNSTSRGSSQADLLMDNETPIKSPLLPVSSSSSVHGGHHAKTGGPGGGSAGGAGTKPSSASGNDPNRRCVSVNDIRRAFEKAEASLSSSLKAASTR
jgi:hypothetical protein